MTATCESCAALVDQNDALQQRAQTEFEKREAIVDQLADAQRKIAALKGELTKLRQDSPKMGDAEEVFRFWVARLHKNARTTFGPARQQKVIARLNEKSLTEGGDRKDDLLWAIRGLEARPFVGDGGRRKHGGRREDELELVCRSEVHVERFMGYADEEADGAFRSFVAALEARFGEAEVCRVDSGHQPVCVVAPCPGCGGDTALRALHGRPSRRVLVWVECSEGCRPGAVLEALREPEAVAA